MNTKTKLADPAAQALRVSAVFKADEEIVFPTFADPVSDLDVVIVKWGDLYWQARVRHRNGTVETGSYGVVIRCVGPREKPGVISEQASAFIFPRNVAATKLAESATQYARHMRDAAEARYLRGDYMGEAARRTAEVLAKTKGSKALTETTERQRDRQHKSTDWNEYAKRHAPASPPGRQKPGKPAKTVDASLASVVETEVKTIDTKENGHD